MADNKNPMQNDILSKALVLVIAVAVSLGVPIAVTRFGGNTDTQTSSQVSEKISESSESADVSENAESKTEEISEVSGYYMADISNLENVDYFAGGTLEHIFDGTINKKGNATGYHYTMVLDSKGKIIDGTRSEEDENGVFTGNVEVDGIKNSLWIGHYGDIEIDMYLDSNQKITTAYPIYQK